MIKLFQMNIIKKTSVHGNYISSIVTGEHTFNKIVC